MVNPLQAPPLPDRDMKPDEGTPYREGNMLTNELHSAAAAGQGACGGRETPARVVGTEAKTDTYLE